MVRFSGAKNTPTVRSKRTTHNRTIDAFSIVWQTHFGCDKIIRHLYRCSMQYDNDVCCMSFCHFHFRFASLVKHSSIQCSSIVVAHRHFNLNVWNSFNFVWSSEGLSCHCIYRMSRHRHMPLLWARDSNLILVDSIFLVVCCYFCAVFVRMKRAANYRKWCELVIYFIWFASFNVPLLFLSISFRSNFCCQPLDIMLLFVDKTSRKPF